MPTLWYDGIVKKIDLLAPNVRRLLIEVPSVEQFDFQAGQFITLDLPIGDKRLQRWRSYSLANAPDGSNQLELCVVRSPSGEGSRYLFEQMEVGSTLRFKGPDGGFILPEKIETDLVFICTGTGVAPFRSMLLDIQNNARSHRNIHLIFGTREEDGVLYRDDFESLTKNLSNFRYDIALSRQPDWEGYQGYVHPIYAAEYHAIRPDVHFYICGWSNMIDEAVENLLIKMGYDRSQIHYELYG